MTLPDRQSTSLQDEVRRAGQRIDLWRCWLYGYIAAPLILVTMFLLVAHGAGYVSPGFAFFMVTWLGSGLVGKDLACSGSPLGERRLLYFAVSVGTAAGATSV